MQMAKERIQVAPTTPIFDKFIKKTPKLRNNNNNKQVLHHNSNNNNDMHPLLASDKWKEKRRNKNDTETQRKEKKKGDQILGRMRRTVPPAPSATDFSKRQAKIIRPYYWMVVHVITSHHLPECRRRNMTWWSQMNRQDILIQNV